MSAVAKAAYISGEKSKMITTEQFTITAESVKLYIRKFCCPIMLHRISKNALFCGTLWNVPKREKSSQTARHIDAALPVEISRSEQIDLVRHFCQQCFVSKGICVDFAIHDKGDGNPHVHILLTTRKVNENGFTKKERTWNDKALLIEWRKLWADWCNHKLYFVSNERIDHRNYKTQGISKTSQKHLGAAACAIEKKGYRTDKGSYNRKVILTNTNSEIKKFNFELSKLNLEKRSIKKEIIETELGCPISETFGIESDKIPNMGRFVAALNNANIVHTIKNKNDGKQVVFFANRDKEKVINIFNANNRAKSVKKHRSR